MARKWLNIRVLLYCVLLVLSIPPLAAAVEVSDPFTGAGPVQLGANWDPHDATLPLEIVSNAVRSTSAYCTDGVASGFPCVETWNANTWNANQFAEITIGSIGSGDRTQGVVLRHSATAGVYSGYYCVAYSGASQIYKLVAGGYSLLDDTVPSTWTTGDKLRCTVTGTSPNITITLYKNNVQDAQITGETSFSSTGRIGVAQHNDDGVFSTNTIDSFRGGDGDGAVSGGVTKRRGAMVLR